LSATAAKATRRDIRKAFGARAVAVIDAQGAALGDTVLPLLESCNARLTVAESRLDGLDDRANSVSTWFVGFERLSLSQRLRWLLTGRLP
jgi:hypothetical protein